MGSHGRFITFEGPEGAGKSTHAATLAAALRAAGLEVVSLREPGGTAVGERIRTLVREEYSDAPNARCETLLFLAARAQLVAETIRPALAAGRWVVCDRFADSTFAYQGYGRGLDLTELAAMNRFAAEGLEPDLTILLDVTPETGRGRLASRQAATGTSADRIESAPAEFHRRLRDGFLEMAARNPRRFATIDASGAAPAVDAEIFRAVAARLRVAPKA